MRLAVLACALVLDRLAGDPPWLWRRLPHPVALFGRGIEVLDRNFNDPGVGEAARRWRGIWSLAFLVALAGVAGWILAELFARAGLLGLLLEVLVVSVFLAQKSLLDHVRAVADGLAQEGLAGGRRAVAMIVGRDPETLDGPGIRKAAIESLAENFSDGIVAPAFWFAVAGLPGLMVYKLVNTADSMIGHLSERHRAFGWAAARLDDLMNWPAARLSAMLIAAGAGIVCGAAGARRALSVVLRDADLHRSPNAGRPESAMAGALDLALGGPRSYGGRQLNLPYMNAAGAVRADATALARSLAICQRAFDLLLGLVVVAVLVAVLLC